jgi:O-antigen ligase
MSLAYAALWIYVFALPWENLVVIPGVGSVVRLAAIVALVFALLATVFSGRFRRLHLFHLAAVVFVVISGATLLIFGTVGRLPFKYETYVQLVLVLWIIWEVAPTRRRILGLFLAYVLGAYVSAFSTIMVYRTQAGLRRFAAAEFDFNDLANISALALPIAWYLGMTYRQPLLRWLCRGYLLVGLIVVGLTGSRGGMLTAMVAILIVPMTMTKLSRGKLVTGIALLGISGALAIAYLPKTVMERLSTTRTEVEGGTLGGRVRIWKAGLQAFVEQPVTGRGVGAFPIVVRPILGAEKAGHNSFLTVLVEQGIVGFLLYLTMFVAVFHAALNLPPLERRFALVLFAALFIAMIPVPWEDSKQAWFILAAILGLACARDARAVGAGWQPSRGQPARRPPPMAGRPRKPLAAPLGSADRNTRA